MRIHRSTPLSAVAGPLLAEAITAFIAQTGRCRLGLSGGSTPAGTMSWLGANLSGAALAGLWITWVDERNVPLRHPDSSHRLAAETGLLNHAGMVLPMCFGGELSDEKEAFDTAFAADFDGGLDIALLGVGPDGHIASLFPGHPGLSATGLSVAISDSPKPPLQRLSLTLPVLEAVTVAMLLARGAGKAEALSRADPSTPISRYRPTGYYHWVLDEAAAAALESR
ncbi:MAG: 6-phosphogluconolactonase [Myxococcota bacterium]